MQNQPTMQEPTLNPESVAKEIVEHFEMMGVENITPLKTANVLAMQHMLEKVFAKVEQRARDEERKKKPPFPPHKGELSLSHNPHLSVYETVKQHLEGREDYFDEWATPTSREKAIKTNELWVIHWYPNTPVGFNTLAGATLEEILESLTPPTTNERKE